MDLQPESIVILELDMLVNLSLSLQHIQACDKIYEADTKSKHIYLSPIVVFLLLLFDSVELRRQVVSGPHVSFMLVYLLG